MEDLLFTIVTVSYNSSPFLQQTIESVLAQSYRGFEYIICDDCSADDSWKIIESFTDPRIRKYRNDTNIGEYANRNKAVQHAAGKYLVFIDGDDIMYGHALATYAGYIKQFPECAMLFAREWDFRILYPYKAKPIDIYRFEYLDGGIRGGNFTKVVFKTEILKAHPFPAGIRSGDSYIQLRIGREFPALVIPDGLTWWRRRKGNATEKLFSDSRYWAEMLNYKVSLLETDCPLPPDEKERAKVNLYGLYMRKLLRMVVSFEWPGIAYLLREVKIPAKYYKTIFMRSNHRFYEGITGDRPLHSEPDVIND